MKQFISTHLHDLSDEKSFRFSLSCTECGKQWFGNPVRFSKSDTSPTTEGKRVVYSVLYRREQEAAKNSAVTHAINHFNVCPVCGRLVCNDCFLVCEDIDLCVCCADQLDEQGEPVHLRIPCDL